MRIIWNLEAMELWDVFFCEYARSKDPILDLGSDLRETDMQNFFFDGEPARSKFSIHHGGKTIFVAPIKGFVF